MANKEFKIKGELSTPYVKEFVAPSTSSISGGANPSMIAPTYTTRHVDFVSSNLNVYGLFFKPDGTKLYILDSTRSLFEYSLTTAFDLTTATQDNSVVLATDNYTTTSLSFSSDGYYFYVIIYNTHEVRQYSLTTAWDTSSVSTDDSYDSFDFSTQLTFASAHAFDPTGEFFSIFTNTGGNAATYQCSTNWDITTASLVGTNTFPNTRSNYQVVYGPDNKLFLSDYFNDGMHELIGTSANVSDMIYSKTFYFSAQSNGYGFGFGDDFSKIFIGATSGDVFEYSCTADSFNIDLSKGSFFDFTASSTTQINIINPSNSSSLTTAVAVIEGATNATFGWGQGVVLDTNAQSSPDANETNVYSITSSDGGETYTVASIITGAA